jgi:flagellar secretion chaperone FliS
MLHQNALRAYEQVEQDCMVAGASRHRLVEILFSELLGSIDRALLGISTNDAAARSSGVSKALTIVYALSTSLDFEKGGQVAQSLAEFYEWSRRQLIGSNKDRPVERLTEVRKAMAELAEAWSSIADTSV